MTRKSLFAALGFLGVLVAGAAGASTPAAAHYGCGPWNNWCAKYHKPGFNFYFGYGKPYYYGYGHKYGYKYGYKHGYKHGHKHGKHWR